MAYPSRPYQQFVVDATGVGTESRRWVPFPVRMLVARRRGFMPSDSVHEP